MSKLHDIRQRQMAYFFFAEDYSPREIATMYEVKVTTIIKAIQRYMGWYV